jgi:hypothetical protein
MLTLSVGRPKPVNQTRVVKLGYDPETLLTPEIAKEAIQIAFGGTTWAMVRGGGKAYWIDEEGNAHDQDN